MIKKYRKLNIDDNNLAIGNLCRVIKNLAINKSSALQSEIFCVLFNLDSVNDTTINNYCIGCRAINNDYKQIYISLQNNFKKDKNVLVDIVMNIIFIMEGNINNLSNIKDKLEFINNNNLFKKLCDKLYNISKNDKQVDLEFKDKIYELMKDKNYYEAFVNILFFIILDKIQPIYEDNLKIEVIENILSDTNISALDLEEFLNLKFRDSTNYDYSIKMLAKKGNPYACYELGTQEYYGYMAGYPRYDVSYRYLKIASDAGHPGANYLIATMLLKKRLGSGKKKELEIAYDYLTVAITHGSIEALNTIGLFYLRGIHPVSKDKKKAIEYFKKAILYDYVYAYNNLGMIYEQEKKYDKAFECYLASANLGESWACNKIGEYYRLGINNCQDMNLAYKYYQLALDCNYKNICYYAKYNLAKYFYLDGCSEVVLIKDRNLAIEYLEEASRNGIIEATIELIYIYADSYLKEENKNIGEKIKYLVRLVEHSSKYNKDIKKEIEDKLRLIKNNNHIDIGIIEKTLE